MPALVDEAKERGISSRNLRCRDGRMLTTRPLRRGNLYDLLANPIYIGKIKHRDNIHDGEHQPIVDDATFAAAQTLLTTQAPRRASSTNAVDSHLLTGILFDEGVTSFDLSMPTSRALGIAITSPRRWSKAGETAQIAGAYCGPNLTRLLSTN